MNLHALDARDNPRVDKMWGPAHQYAFDYLKRALASRPLLCQIDHSPGAGALVLQTDASDVGLGACLMQRHHGKLLSFPFPTENGSMQMRNLTQSFDERDSSNLKKKNSRCFTPVFLKMLR